MDNKLYVVYLGGKVAEDRMGEDHEVVLVVADCVSDARKRAKAKWGGLGDPHVDAVRCIDVVDGCRIVLEGRPVDGADVTPIDSTWVP